jgi:hypothetical protein
MDVLMVLIIGGAILVGVALLVGELTLWDKFWSRRDPGPRDEPRSRPIDTPKLVHSSRNRIKILAIGLPCGLALGYVLIRLSGQGGGMRIAVEILLAVAAIGATGWITRTIYRRRS